MNFIKLNASIGAIGEGTYKPVIVNFDHVRKVSEPDQKAGRQPRDTKVTFSDGSTLMVKESLDFIEAQMMDKLEKYYRAPDPKDA